MTMAGHWDTTNLYPLGDFTNPASFPIDVPLQRHESRVWLLRKPDWGHRVLEGTFNTGTNFTIVLGGYSWRVHSHLVSEQCEFLKIVTKGLWQEAQTCRCALHDDHPWMIGRMIQYFYTGSYDYTHARFCRAPEFGGPKDRLKTRGITLSQIMSYNNENESYTKDETADGELNTMQIDAAMYKIADKYGIPDLRKRVLQCIAIREIKYEPLVQACTGEFRHLMNRDYELKKGIAQKVADSYKKLRKHHSAWIERWIVSDPAFGLMVMDSMQKVDVPFATITNPNDRDKILSYNARPLQLFEPPTVADFPSFATSISPAKGQKRADTLLEAREAASGVTRKPAAWQSWQFVGILEILSIFVRYFR